jgi:hypothetical protein
MIKTLPGLHDKANSGEKRIGVREQASDQTPREQSTRHAKLWS